MSNGAYGYQFAKRRKEKGKWRFCQAFADEVIKIVNGGSVLDLGAGIGNYVRYYRDAGLKADGYDGIEGIWKLSDETVWQRDLSQPFGMITYDWATCLETGEHIPPDGTETLLESIDMAATQGVIISWGQPGQRGKGHINCRPKAEIQQWFIDRGYTIDENAGRRLAEVTKYACFRLNVFVARKS